MKIAIISDVHDHLLHLRTVLAQIQDQDALICCGDLCSPFILLALGQGFSGEIHVVFGNNDGDTYRMAGLAGRFSHVHLHAEYAELTLGGLLFAINHFDSIGRALAKGEVFDVVCFGHNHRFETAQVGKTRIINPGELFGLRYGVATYALFDTESGEVQRVEVPMEA